MSHNNGFSYLPHYKPGAQQGGQRSSYQKSSNGYNTSYQGQIYPSMNGAPAMQQFPFAQTVARSPNAYSTVGPAGMPTTMEGENFVTSTAPQNNHNVLDFPAATTQAHGTRTLPTSSMQQMVKHNHHHASGYTRGDQNRVTTPFAKGYGNQHFDTGIASTGEAVSLIDMQTEVSVVAPMYARDRDHQPQAYASSHGLSEAIQRPTLASSPAGLVASQLMPQHAHPGSEVNARVSLSTPSGSNDQSPNPSKYSSQEPISLVSDETAVAQSPDIHIQAQTASSPQDWPQLSAAGLKSKRAISVHPEVPNSDSPPFNKATQAGHARTKPGFISFQNTPNSDALSTKSPKIATEASLEPHFPSLDGRNSEQSMASLNSTPRPHMMIDRLKGQIERLPAMVAQAGAVNNAAIGVAAGTAKSAGLINGVVEGGLGMEIRQTIEKLLHQKAKHPQLFSKIWVQVKKETKITDRVPSDKGPSAAESKDKISTLLNGSHTRGSISTLNQSPSEPVLSVRPSQPDDYDLEENILQQRKRQSTENKPKEFTPLRQTLGSGSMTTATSSAVDRLSPGPMKSASIDQNSSAEANGNFSPPRKINFQSRLGPGEIEENVAGGAKFATTPTFPNFWSKEKKTALAHAVKNKLASISRDPGTTISTEEIAQALNNCSNFAELCESLKRKGFNITVGYFHRWWSSTVIGFEARSSEDQKLGGQFSHYDPKNEIALPFNSFDESSLPVNDDSEVVNWHGNGICATRPLHEPADRSVHPIRSITAVPQFSHDGEPVGAGLDDESVDAPQYNPMTGEEKGEPRNHYHLNKYQKPTYLAPFSLQERAKKRGLAEVIDLTTSDEGVENRRMRARVDVVQDANGVLERASPSDTMLNRKTSMYVDAALKKKTGISLPATEDEGMDLSQFTYAKSERDLLHSRIIVREMDVKNDALRRSSYDHSTIARDVLASAAKHPTQAPLNHHLKIIQEKFVYVDNKSDLATFRWDLVDPDAPNTPTVGPRIIDMDDKDDEVVGPENSARTTGYRKQAATTAERARRAITSDISAKQNLRGKPSRPDQKMMSRLGGAERRGRPSTSIVPTEHRDRKMSSKEIGMHDSEAAQQDPDDSVLTISRKPADTMEARSDSSRSTRVVDKTRRRLPSAVKIPSLFRPREVPAQSNFRSHGAFPGGLSGFRSREVSAKSNSRAGVSPGGSEPRRRAHSPVPMHRPKPTRSGSTATLHSRTPNSTSMRPSGLRNSVSASDGIAVVIQSPRKDSARYAN